MSLLARHRPAARRTSLARSARTGLVLAVALSVTVAAGAATPRHASADPVGDLSNQAALLVSQIESTSESVTALSQQYDGVELNLQQAQQVASSDTTSLTLLQHRVSQLRHLIDERAVADYEASIAGEALPLPNLANAEQLAAQDRYASDQANDENGTLDELVAEVRTLTVEQHAAQQAQVAELVDTQRLAWVKAQLEAANAQELQTLSQVQGALALLVPDAEQAEADAELSIVLAEYDPGGVAGDPSAYPGLPPVSGVAAVAIAFARAQLGKPYLYAAAGPGSYDCSGLVMAAFGFAGVRLPHYSGAQYAMLPHVSLLAMQPGDLLFWGPGGSVHVAIYVGAGRILQAGGTRDDVNIEPIWGHPVGAARVP